MKKLSLTVVFVVACFSISAYTKTELKAESAVAPEDSGVVVVQSTADKKSADELRQRMLTQRPLVLAARMIQDAVKAGPHDGYAGIVLEEDEVVLWWKGTPPAHVQQAVKEARKASPISIASAKHSRAELYAAAEQIRSYTSVDDINTLKDPGDGSRLVVSIPLEKREASVAAVEQVLPLVEIDTEFVYEEKMETISRTDDTPPWSGGAQIINSSIGAGCTSGFGVIANGRPAVLTAGHCATANGQTITDGSGEFIGFATEKTNHDQMIVPTTSTDNLMYVGPRTSNTTKQVTGWEPVFIGELICQSGVTTAGVIGSELCGLQVLFFHTDSESLVEANQINGEIGARPGDSGGPLYSDLGNTVIAKGTMTRVAGSRIGFQDITTANEDFGGIQIAGSGPSGGAVTLYQHCNFTGSSASFDVGSFDLNALQAAGLANDDISSVRVTGGHSITLYQHSGFGGATVTLTGDDSCLTDNNSGGVNFNDQVSSIRVESTAVVTLYQHCNFTGTSASFEIGSFNLSALQAAGIQNDDVSSVEVSAGHSVTLYQHDSFSGASITLSGNDSCLTDNNSGGVNFNDQISSMSVN